MARTIRALPPSRKPQFNEASARRPELCFNVMAWLGPAIHDLNTTMKEFVDARAKPEHDGICGFNTETNPHISRNDLKPP